MPHRNRLKLMLAFSAIYFIWGSTYLVILYAIQTIPPLLMGGTRFLIAGSVLYVWARVNAAPAPTIRQWQLAAALGAMFFFVGNGGVVLAEQWVPSGLTALLVATVPLWVAILEWIAPGGRRPRIAVWLGLGLGMAGVILLSGVGASVSDRLNPLGVALLMGSSVSWAVGTMMSRRVRLSDSPLLASGMQMLSGGSLLLAGGLVRGEWRSVHVQSISTASWLSLLYLAVLGSIVAFTAYSWLLKKTAPSNVATYAYVNPVVAMLLGWILAGETISGRTAFAMTLIVAAVMLITIRRDR